MTVLTNEQARDLAKQIADVLRPVFDDFSLMMERQGGKFNTSVSRSFSTLNTKFGKSFDQLDEEREQETRFLSIANKHLTSFGLTLTSTSQALEIMSLASEEGAQDLINAYEALVLAGENTDEFALKLKSLGLDFDDLEQGAEHVSNKLETAARTIDQARKIADQQSQALRQFIDVTKQAAKGFFITGMLDAANAAMQFGTTLAPLTQVLTGMSGTEMAQLQASAKQSIGATRMSLDEFNDNLIESGFKLREFTGSLKDGADLYRSSLNTVATIAGAGADIEGFTGSQADLFMKWNRTFAVTSDQFKQFNEGLLLSNETQASMYKLDRTARLAKFEELQVLYQKLRTEGLLDEQAKAVISSMQTLANMSTKERFITGAKLQQLGGMLGIDQNISRRASELLMQRKTDTPEFVELMKNFQTAMAKVQQTGGVSAIPYEEVIKSMGLDTIVGEKSPTAVLETTMKKLPADIAEEFKNSTFTGLKDTNEKLDTIARSILVGSNMIKDVFSGLGIGTGLLTIIWQLMGINRKLGGFGIGGGASGPAGPLGKMGQVFDTIKTKIGSFFSGLFGSGSFLGRIFGSGGVVGRLFAGLGRLGPLVGRLGPLFLRLAGPIGWTITAVMLLWPLLKKLSPAFEKLWSGVKWVGEKIGDVFGSIFSGLGDAADSAGEAFSFFAGKLIDVPLDWFKSAVEGLGNMFTWLKDKLYDLIPNWMKTGAQAIGDAAKQIGPAISEAASGVKNVLADMVPDWAKEGVAAAKEGMSKGWDAVSGWFSDLKQGYTDVMNRTPEQKKADEEALQTLKYKQTGKVEGVGGQIAEVRAKEGKEVERITQELITSTKEYKELGKKIEEDKKSKDETAKARLEADMARHAEIGEYLKRLEGQLDGVRENTKNTVEQIRTSSEDQKLVEQQKIDLEKKNTKTRETIASAISRTAGCT